MLHRLSSVGSVAYETNDRGDLYALEFRELPFVPKRLFWIRNVPDGSTRGCHAHRVCRQIFVVMGGTCTIHVEWPGGDGESREMCPGGSFLVEPWTWVTLRHFSSNCVLAVLCSHSYDKKDYITSKDYFERTGRGKKDSRRRA